MYADDVVDHSQLDGWETHSCPGLPWTAIEG